MISHARIAVFVAALVVVADGQTLTVRSVVDPSAVAPSASFIPGEVLQIDVAGFAPLLPITILIGGCGAVPCTTYSFTHPLLSGALEIDPAHWIPVPGWDGLGLNGGNPAAPGLRTDLTGNVRLFVSVPVGALAGLPAIFQLQAIGLQNPTSGATFLASPHVDLRFDEPAALGPVTLVTPHTFTEGTTPTIEIRGPVLARAPFLPSIRFSTTGACGGALSSFATNVTVVTAASGAVLRCTAPSTIGGGTSGINSPTGEILVTVDYTSSGLFPNHPANATSSTISSPESSSTFLAFQSAVLPTITAISPKGGPVTGGNTVHIAGTNFLDCATVIFTSFGGSDALSPSVTVISGTQIDAVVPAGAEGVAAVTVRNRDHVSSSPRQSALSAPTTDYVYYNFVAGGVTVTSVTPGSIDEGAAGSAGTIVGTCPVIGGYSLLDPAIGAAQVRVGSNILGTDADAALVAQPVSITAPGQFSIAVTFPGYPPGLNPTGASGSSGPGLTNTGTKFVRITLPSQFSTVHRDYASIPANEPSNHVVYRGPAPTVLSIEPNNVGRVAGGQTIDVKGNNFFTQATSFGTATPTTTTIAAYSALNLAAALTFSAMIDEHTLRFTTPDVTNSGLLLPFGLDVIAANVDGQPSSTPVIQPGGELRDNVTGNDFTLVPGLAGQAPHPFALTGSSISLDTVVSGSGPVIFTFDLDTTIPAGFLVNAHGAAPLIIRCRGNLTLDGTIDLSGESLIATDQVPAGAGIGGDAVSLANLSLQSSSAGASGTAPNNPFLGVPFAQAFGGGGGHAWIAAGGGGGAMSTAGVAGQDAPSPYVAAGGLGGNAYSFPTLYLPFPQLTGSTGLQFGLPPGGAGGGAGGIGSTTPVTASSVFADLGQNGRGGHGGGGLFLACDGILTINGTINTNGGDGGSGGVNVITTYSGGGGGGGGGGGIGLAALQGIRIGDTAVITGIGGTGGVGGTVGSNNGGGGAKAIIRIAIPTQSATPAFARQISLSAMIDPPADTTDF